MTKINCNIGFNGETFLTEVQWDTFKKRMPVRYIPKKKQIICVVCNKESTEANPIQNAHIIGFRLGVLYLGLTPDYLDQDENIASAHRKKCNNVVELDLVSSCRYLKNTGIKNLPKYLPLFVLEIWNNL
jgi:hypothetical protein